jgi:hypothetical protein
MNAQKTKPETSQVAPKLFKDAAKRALRLVTKFSIRNKESSLGSVVSVYWATRQGENCGQAFSVCFAQSVDLSAWQALHELGILSFSVSAGGMNLNVWARTLVSASCCSILGI